MILEISYAICSRTNSPHAEFSISERRSAILEIRIFSHRVHGDTEFLAQNMKIISAVSAASSDCRERAREKEYLSLTP